MRVSLKWIEAARRTMRRYGAGGRIPGWLCVNLTPARVDVAHVIANGKSRPEILLCDSYRKEGDGAAALTRLRRELRLDRYRCTTLLGSGGYQMLQVEAPNVPKAEAKNAVRWKIKDMIDFPVEAAPAAAKSAPRKAKAKARRDANPAAGDGAPAREGARP